MKPAAPVTRTRMSDLSCVFWRPRLDDAGISPAGAK
jgi:hypothetical protein